MWIESATAMVRMMVGAPEEGGVSLTPNQPITRPMAAAADMVTTRIVAMVPGIERVRKKTVRASTMYMAGVSVARSRWAASAKEFESATEPVSSKRISGWAARISASRARAWVITSAVAAWSSRGIFSVATMAVVVSSSEISRLAITGSPSAMAPTAAASASVRLAGSATRSRTVRSSFSALVCW